MYLEIISQHGYTSTNLIIELRRRKSKPKTGFFVLNGKIQTGKSVFHYIRAKLFLYCFLDTLIPVTIPIKLRLSGFASFVCSRG